MTENNADLKVNTENDKVILRLTQDLMQTMKSVGQFIVEKEQKIFAAYRLLRQFRWDLFEQSP